VRSDTPPLITISIAICAILHHAWTHFIGLAGAAVAVDKIPTSLVGCRLVIDGGIN
jgi:hypothetical protein